MSADLCNAKPGHWDAPLPEERRPAWELWCQSLLALDQIRVPRAYSSKPLNAANRVELHTFCDASNEVIGAVSYLKSVQGDGHIQVSFILGKAKLATFTSAIGYRELEDPPYQTSGTTYRRI